MTKPILTFFRASWMFASVCLIFPAAAQAQAIHTLPLKLEYFEDKNRELGIEHILARERKLAWRPVKPENLQFGYSQSRFWFRFRIPRVKLEYGRNEPLLLDIPYAYFSKIALHSTLNGRVLRSGYSGMEVSVVGRGGNSLQTGKPFFRIPALRNPHEKYFLLAESNFPVNLPIRLMEAPQFGYSHWREEFVLGTFFGLLILAAIFNGVLAIVLRSLPYTYYAFFVAFLTMLFLGHEGLGVQFFWPNVPWWASREMYVWGSLTLLFYALFVREFLDTPKNSPVLERIMFTLVAFSTACAAWLMVTHNQHVAILAHVAVVIANLLFVVISVSVALCGVRAARYVVASSLIFNLGTVLYLLHMANVVHAGEWIMYLPFFGAAAEVVLLNLALADRIRETNRELADQKAGMILADKLSALGRMAGEIAHEINNPLAIIHANAVLLREHAKQMPYGTFNWVGVATTIEQTTTRISKVVKGMRALSRDSRRDPLSSASLSTILQDSVALCQDRYTKCGIGLEIPDPGRDPLLRCRSSDVCQVLVNLLNNALDALDRAGEKLVRLEANVQGRFVELAVVDSGQGVSPEIRKRIMEPFFTTKEPGKGLGLGLSISRTIVENHGGKLWLDESCGNTRFAFTIPLEAGDQAEPLQRTSRAV